MLRALYSVPTMEEQKEFDQGKTAAGSVARHGNEDKKMSNKSWKRPCAAYDEEGVCIAVGESVTDLARQLGIDPSAVTKGCKGRSRRYAYIMSDEELERYERREQRRTGRKPEKVG